MAFDIITFAAFATVAGICIQFGGYLDKKPNIVNDILQNILEKGKTFNVRAFCQMFIKSFDSIYINNFKYPFISYIFWIWIFLNWGFVFYFEAFIHLLDSYAATIHVLWASSVFGTMMFIIFIVPIMSFHVNMLEYNNFFDELKLIIKKERRLSDIVSDENESHKNHHPDKPNNLILLIKNVRNIIRNTSYENYSCNSSLLKGLFMSICVSAGVGISFLIMGIFARLIPKEGVLPADYPVIPFLSSSGYLEFFSIMAILCSFLFVLFFIPSMYVYLFLYMMEKYKLIFRVSPLIVIVSSIFAIFIFSILKSDLIIPLITNHQRFTYAFIPLAFLNIITDSFSILETRYLLTKAVSGSFVTLIIYLILDFLASSLIYLSIPLLTGDLNLFLDAILFDGEMAWVGIFYWSSLFTSLFLYLYIISFIVLTAFYRFSNLKYIAENPSYSLGWIAAIILLISYPLYAFSGLVVANVIPIITLLLFIFIITKVIKRANNE